MRPTTKRAVRLAGITVGMFAVVGALLWFLLDDPESRGPLIRGQPVAYWTGRLGPPITNDKDAISALANNNAVAIPALVQQLSLPDSRVKDVLKGFWRRLPPMLRDKVPEPTTRAELRAGAALAFVTIYEDETHAGGPTLSEAQMILPALTKALQDRNLYLRLNAAVAVGYLGVISTQAIESCDVALKDTHWWVRGNAVNALGRLAKSDEQAIPRIRSALSDSHPDVREQATNALERLGISAQQDDASRATEAK